MTKKNKIKTISIDQIIQKRKKKQKLNISEISYIVENYSNNLINEQKMGEFLQTFLKQDISDEEAIKFFQETYKKAKKIDLSEINEFKIDKHSTGGIGDKVTILLLPILTALNVKIYKFSGKHLGYTGGTIDKLNSFKNIKLDLEISDFIKKAKKNKAILCQITKNISEFEKKVYCLRTKTNTTKVNSLITQSIMIKKIILNNNALVIDLKIGKGSLFDKKEDAYKFAKLTKKIAKNFKRKITILATEMNEPIGHAVGNKIEIVEAIKNLEQIHDNDLMELITNLVHESLLLKGENYTFEESRKKINQIIKSGLGIKCFRKIIENQDGDFDSIYKNQNINTKYKINIKAWKTGYLHFLNVDEVGWLLDKINNQNKKTDYEAGIYFYQKEGDWTKKNQIIATIYTNIDLNKKWYQNKFKQILNFKKEKLKKNKSKIIKIFR